MRAASLDLHLSFLPFCPFAGDVKRIYGGIMERSQQTVCHEQYFSFGLAGGKGGDPGVAFGPTHFRFDSSQNVHFLSNEARSIPLCAHGRHQPINHIQPSRHSRAGHVAVGQVRPHRGGNWNGRSQQREVLLELLG